MKSLSSLVPGADTVISILNCTNVRFVMPSKVIQIREECDKQQAVLEIVDMDIDQGKEVVIRELKLSLSTVQRNAYWWWNGIVSVTTGETKEEVYIRHKKEHLVKILRRDDPDFEAYFDALTTLKGVNLDHAVRLFLAVIKGIHMPDLSCKQMREFMDQVQTLEGTRGINLPDPDPNWRKGV